MTTQHMIAKVLQSNQKKASDLTQTRNCIPESDKTVTNTVKLHNPTKPRQKCQLPLNMDLTCLLGYRIHIILEMEEKQYDRKSNCIR